MINGRRSVSVNDYYTGLVCLPMDKDVLITVFMWMDKDVLITVFMWMDKDVLITVFMWMDKDVLNTVFMWMDKSLSMAVFRGGNCRYDYHIVHVLWHIFSYARALCKTIIIQYTSLIVVMKMWLYELLIFVLSFSSVLLLGPLPRVHLITLLNLGPYVSMILTLLKAVYYHWHVVVDW
jgi:hypothetical protein